MNGSATRLYYLDGNSHVNELAWNNNKWVNTNMTANVTDPPAPAAAAGSALACFGSEWQRHPPLLSGRK